MIHYIHIIDACLLTLLCIAIILTSGYIVYGHCCRRSGANGGCDGNQYDIVDEHHWRCIVIACCPVVRLALVAVGELAAAPVVAAQIASLTDLVALHQFQRLLLGVYFYRSASMQWPVLHMYKWCVARPAYREQRLAWLFRHQLAQHFHHRPHHCYLSDLIGATRYSIACAVLYQLCVLLSLVLQSARPGPITMLQLVPLMVLGIQLWLTIDIVSAGRTIDCDVLAPGTKLAVLLLVPLLTTTAALVPNRALRVGALLLTLWMQAVGNAALYPTDELRRLSIIDLRYAGNV